MFWEEISPGTFSRPLSNDEIFFAAIGSFAKQRGREHWAIDLKATITPYGTLTKDDVAQMLRRGWAHLRFRQPMIAASCSNNSINYTVPNAAALEEWLQQSFFVNLEAPSAVDMKDRNEGHGFQLYYIPRSDEILLYASHWRIDGAGIILVLGLLLQLAFDPNLGNPESHPWGEETTRFNPTVQDVIPLQESLTAAQQAHFKEIESSWLSLNPSKLVGLPYQGGDSTPSGSPVSDSLILTPDTTTKIIKACKQRGYTVTTAIHASLAMAHFTHQRQSDQGRNYGCHIIYDMRRFLPEKYRTAEFAVVPFVSGWGTQVSPGADWENYCRHFQSHYSRGLTQDHLAVRRELLPHLLKPVPENVPKPNDPPSMVRILSMGILDGRIRTTYGSPERGCIVHSVTLGTDMFTREAVIYVLTFRGQLNINIEYNDAYHNTEQMNKFLGTIKDILLKELQLEE